ncbi:MAG: phospholipase D family protein [Deltaproteobacteria bacterium]|nr:phospholipase D family protein [Deltaproteobacteria bacterium]
MDKAIVRKLTMVIRLGAVFAALMMGGCATLPDNFERPVSYAYTHTQDTRIAKAIQDEKEAHPGKSGFLMLTTGLDAFVARAVLADQADRSIDVQYYLYQNDLTGKLLSARLIQAADRGVRIRLLVDDMDLEGRDLNAAILDSHPNVEVRLFNPFSRKTGRISQFLTRYGSVTRRMHNKSFTVDNQATILGGRNIGNEYFEADPDMTFSDLDVLAIGLVPERVSAAFDKYWNSDLAYPATVLKGRSPTSEEIELASRQIDEFLAQQANSEYLQALRNSKLANTLRSHQLSFSWGNAEVIYDQPEKLLHDFDKLEYHLIPKLKPYLDGVTEELILFSPYFVPGKEGTAFLTQLSEKGVRVKILTNSLSSSDVSIIHAGYAKYRKDLLRAGIELYELNKKISRKDRKAKKGEYGSSKASLHAKSFVFDRDTIFVGSLNLDSRSAYHNTEIGVVFQSVEIAGGMGEWFDKNIETIAFRLELYVDEDGSEEIRWHGLDDGKQQVFTTDPYAGFWRRFSTGFLSFFPIESQL